MDISSVLSTELDDRVKGIPGHTPSMSLREVGAQGWNVLREDLPLPLLTLKDSVVTDNEAIMQAFCRERGLSIAPHGKTTMAPQLFKRQLDAGAWGMTAATANQIQVYRRYGVSRILMANQLIGRQNIRFIVEELNRDPEFDFYCLVDSVALVESLSATAASFGLQRPLKVLLELGIKGGRTGCRNSEQALAVVAAVAEAENLCLAGLEGFEGVITGPVADVDRYLETFETVLNTLTTDDFAGVEEVIISAGGSSYFDRVGAIFEGIQYDMPIRRVLRSGCYLTHDSGGYEKAQQDAVKRGWNGQLRPALEVWGYVQSLPEPGLAILTMGKRDFPYDVGLPIPAWRWRPNSEERADLNGCEIVSTNDQHGYMTVPDGVDVAVGDMIVSGISHPCTAFDKWRFIPVVNDDYDVIDGIITYF